LCSLCRIEDPVSLGIETRFAVPQLVA